VTRLIEVEPGRWRVARETLPPARSRLPRPYVISDTMDATEQVDGRFYTSKRAFREVGRQHGLTEVGNEKVKPKVRASSDPKVKRERKQSIKTALEKYKSGHRAGQN